MRGSVLLVLLLAVFQLPDGSSSSDIVKDPFVLDYETAEKLGELPLSCYKQPFPYKPQSVLNSAEELVLPIQNHPIFYGCFDWHSSVHGHWLMANLLKRFPQTPLAERIIQVLDEQFQEEKVAQELKFLKGQKEFERTYGWSWFLKLYQELLELGSLDKSHGWSDTLRPLTDHFVASYKDYLPKLLYPIRVGEHSNTAFGLIFPLQYAQYVNDTQLEDVIRDRAAYFYSGDAGCPISWEPNGNDFLSPCLQEADLLGLMSSSPTDFASELLVFLPQLSNDSFHLEPGHVADQTDGKLVHLHGLNFSRAWNLYSLIVHLGKTQSSFATRLMEIADLHLKESIDEVVGSHYVGSHWLASFLLYALQNRQQALASL